MKRLNSTGDVNFRIPYIDVAKGFGIILVAIGHITPIDYLREFIYIFHMPLFFILYGILFKDPSTSGSIRRAFSLFIPYSSYLVLLGSTYILGDIKSHDIQKLFIHVETMLLGGGRLQGQLGVFWFISCLSFAQMAYSLALRVFPNPKSWAMAATMAAAWAIAAVFARIGFATPLAIGIAPMAMIFIWLGHIVSSDSLERYFPAYALIFTMSVALIAIGVKFHINMKSAEYGPPIIGVLLSASLSIIFIIICRYLSKIRYISIIFSYIGISSMTIMFLHQEVHFLISGYDLPWTMVVVISIVAPLLIHAAIERVPITRLLLLGKLRHRPAPLVRSFEQA